MNDLDKMLIKIKKIAKDKQEQINKSNMHKLHIKQRKKVAVVENDDRYDAL